MACFKLFALVYRTGYALIEQTALELSCDNES